MKYIIFLSLLSSFLLANQSFKQNTQYICLKTKTVKQGISYDITKEDGQKEPFVFILKDNQLNAEDYKTFEFRMKRQGMSSYSNKDFMLLLLPAMSLGLVPKSQKGQVQNYYNCVSKL